ncbi:MAG: PEGA domain-containing protein [Myxococcota bacterium]
MGIARTSPRDNSCPRPCARPIVGAKWWPSLTISFVTGLVFLFVLVPASVEAQRRGTLVLEGDQPGAEVYVDSEPIGVMPIEPVELPPGEHTLRITRPGYTEYTEVFLIRRRRETNVVVDLLPVSMALIVLSEPDGARVFVDGDFAGETPAELELLEGEHEIRVAARGYHDTERTVQAIPGTNDTLDIALELLPPEELQLLEPPEPGFFERPLTWAIIGGSAVVLAAVIVIVVIATTGQTAFEEHCDPSQGASPLCFSL